MEKYLTKQQAALVAGIGMSSTCHRDLATWTGTTGDLRPRAIGATGAAIEAAVPAAAFAPVAARGFARTHAWSPPI